ISLNSLKNNNCTCQFSYPLTRVDSTTKPYCTVKARKAQKRDTFPHDTLTGDAAWPRTNTIAPAPGDRLRGGVRPGRQAGSSRGQRLCIHAVAFGAAVGLARRRLV